MSFCFAFLYLLLNTLIPVECDVVSQGSGVRGGQTAAVEEEEKH